MWKSIIVCTGLVLCSLLTGGSPALAIEWDLHPGTKLAPVYRIYGTGEIKEGDAEALYKLITSIKEERRADERGLDPLMRALSRSTAGSGMLDIIGDTKVTYQAHPIIVFNSSGGSLREGIKIAYIIRAFELWTNVPENAVCGSACTYAFLGGVFRTVSGYFGIHAMSVDKKDRTSPEEMREYTDFIQQASTFLIDFSREMIGNIRIAEVAMSIKSDDVGWVGDDLLRDWSIITEAIRPSQRFKVKSGPLAQCSGNSSARHGLDIELLHFVCNNLIVARKLIEIGKMVEKLHSQPLAAKIDAEQVRFARLWQRCKSDGDPLKVDYYYQSHASIKRCVVPAVSARWRELSALVQYYETINSEPAKSGWTHTTGGKSQPENR